MNVATLIAFCLLLPVLDGMFMCMVPNPWDLYPTCKIATVRLIALGVFFLQNLTRLMLTHHSIQLPLKPQFGMAVTYPPENLIHTQQSHTILKHTMRKSLSSPITGITHDLSAPVCPGFNMLQYGVY